MTPEIFLDSSHLAAIAMQVRNPNVAGFTTNPSLARRDGVTDYGKFCREAVELTAEVEKPISLEVLSDDFTSMKREAILLSAFGLNVFVKIPITNTAGESSLPLVRELRKEGIKVNVTAILTDDQIKQTMTAFSDTPKIPAILSVFAGRIADTGRDPIYTMRFAAFLAGSCVGVRILWASTREVLNIAHAKECGVHIITVSPEILHKHEQMRDADLAALSLDTVKQFATDAAAASFTL